MNQISMSDDKRKIWHLMQLTAAADFLVGT